MRRFLPLLITAVFASGLFAQTAVLTRSGDNSRSGVYQETTITVASLKASGITQRTVIPVIGTRAVWNLSPLSFPAPSFPTAAPTT